MNTTQEILERAKKAAPELMLLGADVRNAALLKMADALEANAERILAANALDVEAARETIGDVMVDRLRLDEKRIAGMANGIREVAALPDPLGGVIESGVLPNGLEIRKVRVPLGVIGIIYESRPNVTSDAGVLCFKSGNVCVLRGGKEAYRTSFEIVSVLRETLKECGLNENFINMVEDVSRQSATDLMTAVGYVDALIPRGGAGLIRACVENARVPCIQTGTGICHIYVDASADLDKALDILENAKTSRPSVCNAAEVCLVHESVAEELLPRVKKRLADDRREKGLPPVEFRCDNKAHAVMGGALAGEHDFDTEFLDYILAVKVVKDVDEAILHIGAHSTHHSDCIVSRCDAAIDKFTRAVDSAAVYVNASTRFTDGGEFGKGCEIGISTQKLHARGPMGLTELCSYKYIVTGDGQVR
ncbi:MAG: glutamate-5-semialdehyde dehydrogenase [Clostridia bacterium]|nr:glutamate-5-semialdehyde dehydrogenase [Clostridia bacterium]MBR2908640.1 glutamate-5-semialdehyde dehydrogenase [Clostridia bacterium]